MNPLFLQPTNFWVAEQAAERGQRKGTAAPSVVRGFGQIRPVAGASDAFELASIYVLVRATL